MSIADKLKTIAERMEDIYWAGVIKYAKTSIASGSNFVINDSSDERIVSLKAYGRSWQNGTPTPSTPIEIESAKEVKVYGKNLFNINENDNIIPANGASGVRDGNNITITSNASYGNPYVILPQKISLKGGLTYTCSFETLYATNGRSVEFAFFRYGDYGAYLWSQWNYTPNEDIDINIGVYLHGEGDGDIATITNIQCEQNSVATEYEPYTEQTLNLPNLYDGDMVDYSAKKITRKAKVYKLADFEWLQASVNNNGDGMLFYTPNTIEGVLDGYSMMTHFNLYRYNHACEVLAVGQYMFSYGGLTVCTQHTNLDDFLSWIRSENAEVLFALTESYEEELTEEQLAQFKVIHTNYPNTTIVADGEVEIGYILRPDK